MDFAVPANHRVKLKECEKRDKYLDLVRELRKLWNMKATIILIIISTLGTVTKGSIQGLEDLEISGRVKTVQTTALLRSARILRRVLETWGDLLSLKLQWKTISYHWWEKLSRSKIIIIMGLCVSFSRTDSRLCKYHLFICSYGQI